MRLAHLPHALLFLALGALAGGGELGGQAVLVLADVLGLGEGAVLVGVHGGEALVADGLELGGGHLAVLVLVVVGDEGRVLVRRGLRRGGPQRQQCGGHGKGKTKAGHGRSYSVASKVRV